MPRSRVSRMDRRMGQPRGSRAGRRRVAVPERRAPSRPTPGRRIDVAQAARPHLQLQNTIHWIKSIAIEKSLAGTQRQPRRRSRGRSLQADQQPAVSPRLPRVRLSLHPRRPDAASIARRSACGIRTSRTSGAGGRPRRACAAAATRGSSPTRPSRAARRTGPIRPPSRPSCRRCACGCTASIAPQLVADPFLGLGSTAVACAQLGRELHRHRDGRGLSQ